MQTHIGLMRRFGDLRSKYILVGNKEMVYLFSFEELVVGSSQCFGLFDKTFQCTSSVSK